MLQMVFQKNWWKRSYKMNNKTSKSIMKQKENLKELSNQERLSIKKKKVIHLKIRIKKIGMRKEIKMMNMIGIESKKIEEKDQDHMREDISKIKEEEIGPNKKREIIKQKQKKSQMMWIIIIIVENITIIERIITNIPENIEIDLKTDIISDITFIYFSLCS